MIPCHVEHGAVVNQRRVTHVAVVLRQTLRRSTGGGDPPEIHLIGVYDATHEVDPSAIRGPGMKVVVPARAFGVDENLVRVRPGLVRYERRITVFTRVIRQAGAVWGPSHINHVLAQENPGSTAHQRHEPQSIFPAAFQPDFGPVA